MREVRVVFVVFCFETCHLGIAHWDATHGLTARSGTLSETAQRAKYPGRLRQPPAIWRYPLRAQRATQRHPHQTVSGSTA